MSLQLVQWTSLLREDMYKFGQFVVDRAPQVPRANVQLQGRLLLALQPQQVELWYLKANAPEGGVWKVRPQRFGFVSTRSVRAFHVV